MKNKNYSAAIIGASGIVGKELIKLLEERNFPLKNLYLASSEQSIGKKIYFKKKYYNLCLAEDIDFQSTDIVFFCTHESIVKKFVNIALENSCIVIDKSSLHRENPKVPLIIPEINFHSIKKNPDKGLIISVPNCCVVPLALTLNPLNKISPIKRLIISTYQSVSGAGEKAMDELFSQTKAKYSFTDIENKKFPCEMAFNLIPQIGNFTEDGYTQEEDKIEKEICKIFSQKIYTSVTSVRVPTFISHCISVNVEFQTQIPKSIAKNAMRKSEKITLLNDSDQIKFSTPLHAAKEDSVFVSRVREDRSNKNALNLWICCNNLRKGASLNSLQIVEKLLGIK